MRDIAFILSDVSISGGVNVILNHARNLALAGDRITLVTKKPVSKNDLYWHPILRDFDHANLNWKTYQEVARHTFDYVILTYWATIFDAWKFNGRKYLYFVQSIESRFFSASDRITRNVVEATYQIDLGIITVSPWIARYLLNVHRRIATVVPNGIDKDLFSASGVAIAPRNPGKLRVLVEGYLEAWFKQVPRAIELSRQSGCDELWLLTGSNVTEYPGVDRVFNRVPQEQTAAIYRSCDVLVKLSLVEGMFGPPLEMFHCGGTTIVYDVSGHDDYIKHGVNGLVAKTGDDDQVVAYLRQLKATPELLGGLKTQALNTAENWVDWAASSQLFSSAIDEAGPRAKIGQVELRDYGERLFQFFDSPRSSAPERGQIETPFTNNSPGRQKDEEIRQLRLANAKLVSDNLSHQALPLPRKFAHHAKRRLRGLFGDFRSKPSQLEREIRSAIERVRKSGVVDANWYAWINPDVRLSNVDPVEHYVRFGAWEGRAPGPTASPTLSISSVRASGDITAGGNLEQQLAELEDKAANNEIVSRAISEHITRLKLMKLKMVSPELDTTLAVDGANEAPSTPAYNSEPGIRRTINIIQSAGLFQTEWYLARNPDVKAAGMDPVEHYVRFGAAEGRDPNPDFSTKEHMDRHPELLQSGVNPFLHFLGGDIWSSK